MKTRREFITQTAGAAVVGTGIQTLLAEAGDAAALPTASMKGARIRGAAPREDSIRRLGGDGIGSRPMTWMANDRQFVSAGDCCGWPENPADQYYANFALTIEGPPEAAIFRNVSEYPKISMWDWLSGSVWPYYSASALAVDGRLYQYVATCSELITKGHSDGGTPMEIWNGWRDYKLNAAKLIYSVDNGRTWCDSDGSTPVKWAWPPDQGRESMTFYEEPQGAFSYPMFLQMGRDYRQNRDGYVYAYASNGFSKGVGTASNGSINELVMFRVAKAQILDRAAYEYFGGLRPDGEAKWVRDINSRSVVHTFPSGFDATGSWSSFSVVFNAPLGQYMLINTGGNYDTLAVNKSARFYVGIWVAPRPWGPWSQIYEDAAWTPGGDPGARPGPAHIAPKWIAEDGKSFWLTWADGQATVAIGDAHEMDMYHTRSAAEFKRARFAYRQFHPYYACNIQRIDLVVG